MMRNIFIETKRNLCINNLRKRKILSCKIEMIFIFDKMIYSNKSIVSTPKTRKHTFCHRSTVHRILADHFGQLLSGSKTFSRMSYHLNDRKYNEERSTEESRKLRLPLSNPKHVPHSPDEIFLSSSVSQWSKNGWIQCSSTFNDRTKRAISSLFTALGRKRWNWFSRIRINCELSYSSWVRSSSQNSHRTALRHHFSVFDSFILRASFTKTSYFGSRSFRLN